MNKQWFVLHTLTGQENKAMESILHRIKLERMEDFVGRCVVPTERVSEKKNGKKRTITKKIFPGYVLCELALYDETKGLDGNGRKVFYERTWQFVRETTGVIGFVGVDSRDPNARPAPLTQSEIDAILLDRPAGAAVTERPRVAYAVDETVKIVDGAFMGLKGIISIVDPDKGKLKVEVEVFGRKVPVDVEYWQVEKVAPEELAETPRA